MKITTSLAGSRSGPNSSAPPRTALGVHVELDFDAMSRLGAAAIVSSLAELAGRGGRRLNVVFSAGRTPTRVYDLLATDFRAEFDWSRLSLFQMDEYVDASEAVEPFRRYLTRRVVEPLGLSETHLLPGDLAGMCDETWAKAIRDEERILRQRGGIDLVIHGIGGNGHLGFNEPGSSPTSPGRVVRLSSSTRDAIFPGPPPARGVTMGLAMLLAARESILLASGSSKAQAIAAALEGPVSADCPASWLRLGRKTTVIIDRAAGRELRSSGAGIARWLGEPIVRCSPRACPPGGYRG